MVDFWISPNRWLLNYVLVERIVLINILKFARHLRLESPIKSKSILTRHLLWKCIHIFQYYIQICLRQTSDKLHLKVKHTKVDATVQPASYGNTISCTYYEDSAQFSKVIWERLLWVLGMTDQTVTKALQSNINRAHIHSNLVQHRWF